MALKILSPDITHKSDIGGVRLNLAGGSAVRTAAEEMLATVAAAAPDAAIEGFSVQRMARIGDAHELIVGIADDEVFGPVLLFGSRRHGGGGAARQGDRPAAAQPWCWPAT